MLRALAILCKNHGDARMNFMERASIGQVARALDDSDLQARPSPGCCCWLEKTMLFCPCASRSQCCHHALPCSQIRPGLSFSCRLDSVDMSSQKSPFPLLFLVDEGNSADRVSERLHHHNCWLRCDRRACLTCRCVLQHVLAFRA